MFHSSFNSNINPVMKALSRVEWQEAERLNKKVALQSLLTAPEYAHVTQPYVLTLLAMVFSIDLLFIICLAIIFPLSSFSCLYQTRWYASAV